MNMDEMDFYEQGTKLDDIESQIEDLNYKIDGLRNDVEWLGTLKWIVYGFCGYGLYLLGGDIINWFIKTFK